MFTDTLLLALLQLGGDVFQRDRPGLKIEEREDAALGWLRMREVAAAAPRRRRRSRSIDPYDPFREF